MTILYNIKKSLSIEKLQKVIKNNKKILKNKSNSEQKLHKLELKRVDESKGVWQQIEDALSGRGFFPEHVVTGKEFNTLIEQLQPYLHNFNSAQIDLYKELGEVYSLLEGLDKDYIQAILSSVVAIEHTNKKILKEQSRIDKTIEKQKATLVALKQFKEKFNEENSKNSIEKHEVMLSKFNDRLENLEQFTSTIPSEPVSNTGEIEQLRRELNESKQQIQFISNRLLTVFIVSGISIGMLVIALLFMLLR